jgi:hypothetical protein
MICKLFLILLIFPSFSAISKVEKDNDGRKGDEGFVNLIIPVDSEQASKDKKRSNKAALEYLMDLKDPLDAHDARKIQDHELNKRAILGAIVKPEEFVSDVVYTSLQPGSKSIYLNLSMGLPVTVIFKDARGNPVNIYDDITPKMHFSTSRPGHSDANGSTGAISSPENILVFSAKLLEGGANAPVFTTVSDFPVSFDVTINKNPEKQYISRLVVVIDDGQTEDTGVTLNALKSRDSLMRVLNNLPPTSDSTIVRFNSNIKAWKDGSFLWIRTRLDLKYPVHLPQNAASLNGVNVYKTKYSPVISVMNNDGNIERLKAGDFNGY